MLLPETDQCASEEVARRIVEGCRLVAIPEFANRLTCSCSVGIAQAGAGEGTIEELLRRADEALYRAKHEGRDRVVGLDVASLGESAAAPQA